jgi:fructose-1,6-bisphosphatase/inositol monophosphatase family enzyme
MKLTDLERRVVAGLHRTELTTDASTSESDAWAEATLGMALRAARVLREADIDAKSVSLKTDGSPVTQLEQAIEAGVRDHLGRFAPYASMVGEETGGEGIGSGFVVALDPVDGTWAFVTDTTTYAVTLNVFKDGMPYLAVIANPATGEVAYARHDGGTRILRLGLFGGDPVAFDLPSVESPSNKLLVNLHPSRGGRAALISMQDAWMRGEASMVRSPGGSPTWFLLEAARGHYVYANLWGEEPAAPWDLAAGCLAVRGAGGDVVDLDGRSVTAVGHRGTFVAGVDAERVEQVLEILARSGIEPA